MRSLRHLESQRPCGCMWPIIAWLALAWSPVSCLVLPSHQGRSSAAPLAAPTLAHKTTRTPDRNPATIAARHSVVRMNEDQASADARLKARARKEAAKIMADATDRQTFALAGARLRMACAILLPFAVAAQIQDATDRQTFAFTFAMSSVSSLVGNMGMSVISWRNERYNASQSRAEVGQSDETYLAPQDPSIGSKAQTPSCTRPGITVDKQTRGHERDTCSGIAVNEQRDTRPGIEANEQVDYEYSLSLAKRARMFQKEVRKGPHVYGMEEKAYWDAFMSYTAELYFSDAPAEQARRLHLVRAFRAWYYLGKDAKAHPNTKGSSGVPHV